MLKTIVVCVISLTLGFLLAYLLFYYSYLSKRIQKQNNLEKFIEYYFLLVLWIRKKQKGKRISEYLLNNGISRIAIYGMKEIGELLYDDLRGSSISVEYIIDKDADSIFSDIRIVTPEKELDDVDMIIVTPVFYYDEINNSLKNKIDTRIISLKDLLNVM